MVCFLRKTHNILYLFCLSPCKCQTYSIAIYWISQFTVRVFWKMLIFFNEMDILVTFSGRFLFYFTVRQSTQFLYLLRKRNAIKSIWMPCDFYTLFFVGFFIKGWSTKIFKRFIFQFSHLLEIWGYSKKCHPRLLKIDQVFSHKGQEYFAETQ